MVHFPLIISAAIIFEGVQGIFNMKQKRPLRQLIFNRRRNRSYVVVFVHTGRIRLAINGQPSM